MDHGTEAEHRHAEALFAHGELAAAEPLIRRLLGLYTYAGYRHRRGWASIPTCHTGCDTCNTMCDGCCCKLLWDNELG